MKPGEDSARAIAVLGKGSAARAGYCGR